jgi:hypothetical protein
MPRKARLDAPGALHHVIVRGIERRKIFLDDIDRDNFLPIFYSFERLIKRVAKLFEIPRRSCCLVVNMAKQSKPEALYVTGGIESLG